MKLLEVLVNSIDDDVYKQVIKEVSNYDVIEIFQRCLAYDPVFCDLVERNFVLDDEFYESLEYEYRDLFKNWLSERGNENENYD